MSPIRSAGVLLHPTSFPSAFGIGDLGPAAFAYLEWLAGAGVGWWQILPLHPPGPGNSPYSAISTFAGNELLISPEALVEDRLLDEVELADAPDFPPGTVDFGAVIPFKLQLLQRAFDRYCEQRPAALADPFEYFRSDHREWLEDYARFRALRDHHRGQAWFEWPRGLAHREAGDLDEWVAAHERDIGFVEFCQFLFFRQWAAVRARATDLGIGILGDMPIFVALDSAEVWSHPELFRLDDEGRPTVVAGVPPDYFSESGQLWGNPLYDWPRIAEDGYRWWVDRVGHAYRLADLVRLDHFRGFAACWEVPAGDPTAAGGVWRPGPGWALFDAIRDAHGPLRLVAEDLGEITEDVIALRKNLGLPGMAILHFAFSPEPRSIFIPYALEKDLVVYTGTHDNNTSVGWYQEDSSAQEQDLFRRYTASSGDEPNWELIRLALASVAELAIVPHQDLVGLGSEARMNAPGRALGNWGFRITPEMLNEGVQHRLRELIETYGRKPQGQVG